MNKSKCPIIITSGSAYLDIDAYACCVAVEELLRLKGYRAVAYSTAPVNYSVCKSLVPKGHISAFLPPNFCRETVRYVIVDVSNPKYLEKGVSPERVIRVYDHHTGFEEYWKSRIGEDAHIEFIGAAATLVYREWKNVGLIEKMTSDTAALLTAAVLDNTLNLSSSVTTPEDVEAFKELRKKGNFDEDRRASYFSEVQESVEADLKSALFGDVKTIHDNDILPSHIGQIAVWDAEKLLAELPEIKAWFDCRWQDDWMINIIDIKRRCCRFVCGDSNRRKKIEKVFDVHFNLGVANLSAPYLRKEIIKMVGLGA